MSKNETATTYSKEQIVNSQRFTNIQKDVLNALLDGGFQYSLEDAEKCIKLFEKKEAR